MVRWLNNDVMVSEIRYGKNIYLGQYFRVSEYVEYPNI